MGKFSSKWIVGIKTINIFEIRRKLAAVRMDEDQCVVVEKGSQIRMNRIKSESLLANGKGPLVEIFEFEKSDIVNRIQFKRQIILNYDQLINKL
ncbi:unnamed protein product [Paramecium sonneborni]|uniref:Uncharacterized protein n=1 Tax=Paramecium sonneborni TaxID=65129 RepID=A0A8S1R9P4_9CILI|nr:unnamed protein product [Paramecium sonneborni]